MSWLLGDWARFVIRQLGERTRLDAVLLHVLGSIASAVIVLLGILTAPIIAFSAFRSGDLLVELGITTIAIGFAFNLESYMH